MNKQPARTTSRVNNEQVAARNNVDVVVLAAYLCGSALRLVDTEDIAVKTRDVAPGRFSWRRYPDQINIEQVRRRLSDAKAWGLLSGSQTHGWMLTAHGSKYVEDNLIGLVRGAEGKTSVAKADRQWIAAERRRLMGTSAYQKYAASALDAITAIEIGEFFRIDAYTTDDARRAKLDRFLNAFRSDTALGPLIQILTSRIEPGKQHQ